MFFVHMTGFRLNSSDGNSTVNEICHHLPPDSCHVQKLHFYWKSFILIFLKSFSNSLMKKELNAPMIESNSIHPNIESTELLHIYKVNSKCKQERITLKKCLILCFCESPEAQLLCNPIQFCYFYCWHADKITRQKCERIGPRSFSFHSFFLTKYSCRALWLLYNVNDEVVERDHGRFFMQYANYN